jgi:hypothetical protein
MKQMHKSIFIILAAMIFLYGKVNGQFRVKAGLTYSNLSFKSEQFNPHGFAMNYILGLEYNFSAGNLFGVETGLNHYRLKNDDNGTSNSELFRSYISVPLIVSYLPKNLISPGIGILASSVVANDKIYEPIKKVDVSGLVKLTVRPFEHIAFDLGYNLGFIPFARIEITDSNGNVTVTENLNNKFFYLRIGIDL